MNTKTTLLLGALALAFSTSCLGASSVSVELFGDARLPKSSFDLLIPFPEEDSGDGSEWTGKVRDMRFAAHVGAVDRDPTTGFVSKTIQKAWHGDELAVVDETPPGQKGPRRFRVSGVHVELLQFNHRRDPATTVVVEVPQLERIPVNFIAELSAGQSKTFDLPRPSFQGPSRPPAPRRPDRRRA